MLNWTEPLQRTLDQIETVQKLPTLLLEGFTFSDGSTQTGDNFLNFGIAFTSSVTIIAYQKAMETYLTGLFIELTRGYFNNQALQSRKELKNTDIAEIYPLYKKLIMLLRTTNPQQSTLITTRITYPD